jgi:serine protease Do
MNSLLKQNKARWVFGILLIGSMTLGYGCQSANTGSSDEQPSRPSPETVAQQNEDITASRSNAITRAVSKASPAVVNITVTSVVQRRRSIVEDEFFRFFNRFNVPQEVTSIGSGFIISETGRVVTNQHVIGESPTSVTVTLPSGEAYEATVLGSDQLTDLALLQMEGDTTFPHISFSESDDVEVGEWAIALGNPFGLFELGDPTVTVGVVSAKNRDFRPDPSNPRVYIDMIQTDASINRGNSGGPLLNSLGEVIGINTFIFTGGTGSGSVGLGFAIPSGRVQLILEQLANTGRVEYDFDLGMNTRSMTEGLVVRYNLPYIQGLLVTEINRSGPAFDAGLMPGDIILQIDENRVVNNLHGSALLRQFSVGDSVDMMLLRGGERYETTVALRPRVEP